MTLRVKALLVCMTLAAAAYLAVTEPSAEGQTTPITIEPQCPEGTSPGDTPTDLLPISGGGECVCPDGTYGATVQADGTVTAEQPCPVLIPPATVEGDPTEPVPFDDGDPAYPVVPPSPHAEPIAGDPAFTG